MRVLRGKETQSKPQAAKTEVHFKVWGFPQSRRRADNSIIHCGQLYKEV